MKLLLLISALIGIGTNAMAQAVSKQEAPKAVINYNSAKSGETNINYNTSFFIYGLSLDDAAKLNATSKIKGMDNSVREISFLDLENKKGTMVKIDVPAANKADLTKKMKQIFTVLTVSRIEYNGQLIESMDKFNF